KYSGKTVTVSYNPTGLGGQAEKLYAAQFEKDTGVKVSLIVHPSSTSDQYAQYQRVFTSKATTPDVLEIDVVYPGAFGQYLEPLDKLPLMSDLAKQNFPTIIDNNTVNGKLVG